MPILLDGLSHLPAEMIAGSGYIRCRCRPPGNLAQDIAIYKLGTSRLPSSGPSKVRSRVGNRMQLPPRPSNQEFESLPGEFDNDRYTTTSKLRMSGMSLKVVYPEL